MTQKLWAAVWNFSEWSGVGLRRFAPFVFGKMIGRKGHKVDDG